MKITKILPYEATPAKALLARAKKVFLTTAQRFELPDTLDCEGVKLEIAPEVARVVWVEDVFIDERGTFYVVNPAPEPLMRLQAQDDVLEQLCALLLARGVLVEKAEDGVFTLPIPELREALENNGIGIADLVRAFNPIRPPKPTHKGGHCCCGHHHHHGEGEECGCGHHHHHHEDGEECCCGHHHHDEGEECACGHHHHHEDGDECCCGHHHHHGEGEECGCGHHHHHHEDGEECCCGHHHHRSEEK